MKILIFVDWYLPGYKSGGPVRTIANLVESFGDSWDLKIVTRNRDFGEHTAYDGIQSDCWLKVGKAQVFYLSKISVRSIRKCITEIYPDLIYLNSFFSRLSRTILLLRFLGMLPVGNIVLAPRGEFSVGALKLKRVRKLLYISSVRMLGLQRQVLWQASSDAEKEQITQAVGTGVKTQVARNLTVPNDSDAPGRVHVKIPFACRLVFLSRISRIKNLEHVLKLLLEMTGRVELDIYGPVEDPLYWRSCEQMIAHMPASITVRYLGPIPNREVVETIAQYDFFVLPTWGENFGHVIFEALSAGCPVLISDQTPWRGLPSKSAGWDLALGDEHAWKGVLQECLKMDQSRYAELSIGARELAHSWLADSHRYKEIRILFERALGLQESPQPTRCEKQTQTVAPI